MDLRDVIPDQLTGVRVAVGTVKPGYYNLDNRAGILGVDLVWDLEAIPWPLADGCALEVCVGHVISRINPARWGLLALFDELWRILKPGGELRVITYYGLSSGFLGDPGAVKPVTECTFYYLDPEHRSGLWQRYQPAPWKLVHLEWAVEGNLEAILAKR